MRIQKTSKIGTKITSKANGLKSSTRFMNIVITTRTKIRIRIRTRIKTNLAIETFTLRYFMLLINDKKNLSIIVTVYTIYKIILRLSLILVNK